ncbi:MAG: Rrf2 family transcriptional regulator [Candidatus Omnitrophica bacterium]|nr:Rrf2 family transcriptional regulator [Candidatus Omnitrophota bacterium]
MKLSTKGQYGARLMLDLAFHYGQGPVLLKDIAGRQGISEKYLGHLTPLLKGAGLINSIRGARGGYILARPPQDITLGEIVRAVEGNLVLVECVTAPAVCHRVSLCATRDIWEEVGEKMMEVLDSNTLKDMVERQKQKQSSQPLVYSI